MKEIDLSHASERHEKVVAELDLLRAVPKDGLNPSGYSFETSRNP